MLCTRVRSDLLRVVVVVKKCASLKMGSGAHGSVRR